MDAIPLVTSLLSRTLCREWDGDHAVKEIHLTHVMSNAGCLFPCFTVVLAW